MTTATRKSRPKKAAASRRPKRSAEEVRDQVSQLKTQMDEQVMTLVTTDGWAAMLRTAVSLGIGRYSFGNVMLILSQCPDATRVAGFGQWREQGRQVRKGERSIKILAPMTFRKDDADDAETTDDGKQRTRTIFRPVSVFDISQTDPVDADGNVIPEAEAEPAPAGPETTGTAPAALWAQLTAYVQAKGYTVERGGTGTADAHVEPATRTVRVGGNVVDAPSVIYLAHEVGHIECGHCDADAAEYQRHRGAMETQAESVAYIVAAAHGLDPAALSVPYVAGWAGKTPAEVGETIRTSAAAVLIAARTILAAVPPHAAR